MSEQKTREDYPNSYEYRRENLWKTVSSPDDLRSPNVISYFCKSGKTPITGKVAVPKEVDFPASMSVKEAFERIQEVMTTKKLTRGRRNTLRASMETLQPYQEYLLIALLSTLREAYIEGEEKVMLTWQEFWLLKEGKFSKNKKK